MQEMRPEWPVRGTFFGHLAGVFPQREVVACADRDFSRLFSHGDFACLKSRRGRAASCEQQFLLLSPAYRQTIEVLEESTSQVSGLTRFDDRRDDTR